jgi:hypothetical protein
MARADGKDRGLFQKPANSGVWWIRFADHRKRERRFKVGKKSDAQKAYAHKKQIVQKIKLGTLPETALDGEDIPTLKEYLESITPELEQKKSWRDDQRFLKRWVAMLGSYGIDEIQAKHAVKRRTAQLAKGKKPATVNRETAFLKAALTRAVRDGVLEKNPLAGFKMLPENNEHDLYLTEPQEVRLAAVMAPEDFEVVAPFSYSLWQTSSQYGWQMFLADIYSRL